MSGPVKQQNNIPIKCKCLILLSMNSDTDSTRPLPLVYVNLSAVKLLLDCRPTTQYLTPCWPEHYVQFHEYLNPPNHKQSARDCWMSLTSGLVIPEKVGIPRMFLVS